MKTKRKKNIVILVLFQTLTKTSNLVQRQDIDLIVFLKEVLNFANKKIEIELKEVAGTPETAKQDIKTLDKVVFALKNVFDVLFEYLTEEENKIIQPEYEKFLDNLSDYRDDLELLTDVELWEEVERIHNGTYDRSQYIEYDEKTFWE